MFIDEIARLVQNHTSVCPCILKEWYKIIHKSAHTFSECHTRVKLHEYIQGSQIKSSHSYNFTRVHTMFKNQIVRLVFYTTECIQCSQINCKTRVILHSASTVHRSNRSQIKLSDVMHSVVKFYMTECIHCSQINL